MLGRSSGFSPNDDSIVRNRAYALRKKLEEFYAVEGAEEPLRIDLPKGGYAPRFLDSRVETPAVPRLALSIPEKPRTFDRRLLLGSMLLGVLAGCAGMWAWLSSRLRPPVPAALSAFWMPLLDSPDPVILCVGTPPQSFLRTLPAPPVNIPGTMPVDAAVTAWHSKQRVETHGPYLLQVPTVNSPLWGDAAGAARVAQMLGQNGIQTEMMAERVIALPALRNRNVVFLGTSEYSSGVSRLLRGLPLGIAFDEKAGDHIALEYDAAGTVIKRYPVKRSDGQLTEVYGLITRVKGDGDAEKSNLYLVLSGVSSAGILAAAQYVTSPHHLERLMQSLAADWQSQPLQVLIRVRADRTLPLSFEYVTHFVGPAKAGQ